MKLLSFFLLYQIYYTFRILKQQYNELSIKHFIKQKYPSTK